MRRLSLLLLLLSLLALAACQPSGPRIDPARGSVEGGDTVVISGGAFGSVNQVMFGGKPVGPVTVLGSDQLQVVVPEGDAVGAVDVVLIDSHGKRTLLEKGFEYIPRKDTPSGTGGAK